MNVIKNVPIAALICSCLQRHWSIAFQQPVFLAAVRCSRPALPRSVGVSAATRLDHHDDDDWREGDDGNALISRRDLFSRSMRGAGIAVVTSVTAVDSGHAMPDSLPTLSVAVALEKDGGTKAR
jgi:hypothetical protein